MKILITLFLIVICSGCATYNRCLQKFGSEFSDSITVPVQVAVLVPRDSVITSFVTDTTYFFREIQQGRAKVIVERTNTITTVQARCDTVTIVKTKMVRLPGPAKFGVPPWYKTGFIIACVALSILVTSLVILRFIRHQL
jgi:hypothetical protein